MSNPWFRLYSRIMTDPKIEMLSFEDQRHYVWILCMKNEGFLDEQFPSLEMFDRMMGRKLGLQGEALESAKRRLVSVGLISEDWQPCSWLRLQFVSDHDPTGAERQRKHRDKLRNALRNAPSNAQVTPLDTEQIQIQIQNRTEGSAEGRAPRGAPREKFTAPTLEEVRAYCVEIGGKWCAQDFHDHFTANGWKISGRAPMRDWKAALRKWVREDKRRAEEAENRRRGFA